MGFKRILLIVLYVVATILFLSMIWGMYHGRADVSYGAMALVIALVAVWIEKLEGRR